MKKNVVMRDAPLVPEMEGKLPMSQNEAKKKYHCWKKQEPNEKVNPTRRIEKSRKRAGTAGASKRSRRRQACKTKSVATTSGLKHHCDAKN